MREGIIKRSALKKTANISNNPEMMKMYKNKKNNVVNLSRKVKTEFSESICYTAYLLKVFRNFANHFFQITQRIFKTTWAYMIHKHDHMKNC